MSAHPKGRHSPSTIEEAQETRRAEAPSVDPSYPPPSLAGPPQGMSSPPATIASPVTVSNTFEPPLGVLFIFPSRYLSTIGLSLVFSLGWGPPPDLGLRYRTARLQWNTTHSGGMENRTRATRIFVRQRGYHPPWRLIPEDSDSDHSPQNMLQ